MLEDLDKIDWNRVHHSHGSAYLYPSWIRNLTSDDEGIRSKARWHVGEYANHQGDLWEVSSYIVPFILELIENDSVPEKHKLLGLLSSLAIGTQPRYRDSEEKLQELDWEDGEPIYDVGDYENLTFVSLLKGKRIYEHCLLNDDLNVRATASRVLFYLENRI